MEKFNILSSVEKLIGIYPELKQILSKYLVEQKFTHEVKTFLLNDLAILLLNDSLTIEIATLCSPVLLELLTRASDMSKDDSVTKHEWLCICLSKLVWHFPDVDRFAKQYFEKSYGLFCRFEDDGEPPAKKTRSEMMVAPLYKLVKTANLLLIYDNHSFKELCDWSLLATFLDDSDVRTRWFSYQCLARLGNIKFRDLNSILKENFSNEEFAVCATEEFETTLLWNFGQFRPFKFDVKEQKNALKFTKEDFSKDIVNVEGVLLPRNTDCENNLLEEKFVYVPSVQKSLYRLALAVSAGEPVLLQGAVGCGKTSIIEHLAALTGRRPFEELLKVQLGDHMDSKMLLGTHCCTEVPEEFVWKSGILVQAMTEGYWLLLEDIDCAPMDVISLLVPVLQSRTIVLPGHANPIIAAAGFQLFATQRLVKGFEGSYVEFKNETHIIENQFRRILMDPLNKDELKRVICTKWPRLERICDRILEIYSFFSHDIEYPSNRSESSEGLSEFYGVHDRLVSTRDLFKFCGRMTQFDPKKGNTYPVFENALECFCDSIPSFEKRVSAAKKIGVKFNIPTAKAAFSCLKDNLKISQRENEVTVGRVTLPRKKEFFTIESEPKNVFAYTKQALNLLEKVAVAVSKKEPVLLVGETGTGKTSVVQYLAELTRHNLTVINMSQQSDSVDLIGGYKPVDLVLAVRPVKDMFFHLFPGYAKLEKNARFLAHITNCIYRKKYEEVTELMLHCQSRIMNHLKQNNTKSSSNLQQFCEWKSLGEKIVTLQQQIKQSRNTLIFKFIEGALVKAMKNGDWILLDEINLAEAETLECLSGILEKDDNTLFLLEKGDKEPVTRHPDFRIFACMNPATDVGKKDLPVGIRNRFTEFFVEEIESKSDLTILVKKYLKGLSLSQSVMSEIVDFYLYIRKVSTERLSDGTGHYPHYSLRTLCRALKYASSNPCHNIPRSLYEAFCLSFLSQLDSASHVFVTSAIANRILGKNQASVIKQNIPEPSNGNYKMINGYWVRCGNQEPSANDSYVFTTTVHRNLHDLARIVSAGRFPVLLQGETSVGKTSLIQWLAKATGNICVRVNNHEHTDIQEYIGTYSADEFGKLVFKEGILAEAMRKGYWIILDELNLAPSEVMEALNRVLDDNRELFIPETQVVIKAHPGFMIFATQNPHGLYGGRKVLSRAFRNRFIELHFNEIPPVELEDILHKRCHLPMSYSKKLVAVMHELQMRRRESGVFAGKQGFITLRDLFRWGERYQKMETPVEGIDWMQHLAYEGYLLLAGRVRLPEEMEVIQEVIQKHLGKKINPNLLFTLSEKTPHASKDILSKALQSNLSENFRNVVWTYGMRRLAVLVGKAMQYQEPVLLIGTTGSGKTTICQIFAHLFVKPLHSVNCHMHSESADFLGGLRPVRDAELRESKLFEWADGPLIQAMQEGSFFLSDEISLADDSVLERLNSVLEPEQKILLAEKSFYDDGQLEITAKAGFQFFATMNPGGDYGKKELSPALRNRFTEIWCPSSMGIVSDVIAIVEHNISKRLQFQKYATNGQSGFGLAIAEFFDHYSGTEIGKRLTLSIRDILTWVEFINFTQTFTFKGKMSSSEAYLHGACLAFLDGIGSGASAISNEDYLLKVKKEIFSFLVWQIEDSSMQFIELMIPEFYDAQFEVVTFDAFSADKSCFGMGPFVIDCGPAVDEHWSSDYILAAKTPKANVLRVLRAMQLAKPILLEGSPGVGKTSLISTLAKASGHKLVRINLSEQTDISDLFGADLPVDGGEKGEFAWRDGPLLLALKQGDWILLDELNLASQSVLEGLNACLDHRNEIFIPELGMTFHLNKNVSRIFCCQNPHMQGGSRKGLPQSFLNRFTQVYMKPMTKGDMQFIASSVYSTIPPELISAMVQFNNELFTHVNVKKKWCHYDSSWEFNLRDIFRWCDLMIKNQSENDYNIGEYMKLIYMDRMWTVEDKEKTLNLFERVIKRCGLDREQSIMNRNLSLNVFEDCVQLGHSFLSCKGGNRGDSKMVCIPPAHLPFLESLMKCIEMNWMAILVGPSGSGKSTLVRSLAELCGQELHILSVNSEMDTIELLGGFEQADMNRKIEMVAQELQPILEKAILKCLHPESKISDSKRILKELLCHLINVRQCIYSGSSLQEDNCFKKLNCLKHLAKAIESLKIKSFSSDIKAYKKLIESMLKKCSPKESFNGGQFEWVDSVLINAAKRGHWLLIDDANFCSSSVLDRLNALLEPKGVLTVNEQGIVDGELRTITPHPNFRIILTVNPRNGMISRAMRNRGIEIYVEPISLQLVVDKELFTPSLFAQCKGLVHNQLLLHSCALYQRLTIDLEMDAPCLSDFISAASLCVQMGQKHGKPIQAFHESAVGVYAENLLNINTRNIAVDAINKEVARMKDIKKDATIPITDILPSSIDYRQNPICASIKKQACLFTMVFRDFVGKFTEVHPFPEDKDGNPVFVMPPPENFSVVHLHNHIKRFTVAIRLVFESCTMQSFIYLDAWIRFHLNSLPTTIIDPDNQLKNAFTFLLQFQDRLWKMASEPQMSALTNTVEQIFKLIGYNDIWARESPVDLRWNKYLYQKIMMLLRQKHEDADAIEYQYLSCANRYSLNLLFRSLGFMNEVLANFSFNCRSLAIVAEDIIKNQNLYQDSPLIALISIPQFIKALGTSILEYIEDQSMPCPNECYWKLYEIINSYHVFQRVFNKPFDLVDKSPLKPLCDKQMRLLSLHFSWLLKKVRRFYAELKSMPPTLQKSAELAENLLSCNNPEQRFRHRCTKLLGQPPVFPDQRSADLYQFVIELYKTLDLAERLKSNRISLKDVKSIWANLHPWLNRLCDISYLSIYEKEHKIGAEANNALSLVKSQMYDTQVLVSSEDEIMEVSVHPAKMPTLSDSELALELQLLPLWDYLFVIYEAELLCMACTLSEQDFQSSDVNLDKNLIDMFIKWGTQILGLNPVHLAHLVALQQFQNKQSLAPSVFYFFQHSRHGFSSDALSVLDSKICDKNLVNESNKKEWNCNYSWAKQQPLLTHIISSIHGEPDNSPLMCHFPLGSYSEKIGQLKKAQTLLWKHFEKLANREKTYRYYSASIVISWFNSLLSAIVTLGNVPMIGFNKDDVLKLFEKLKVSPLVMTKGQDNILLLAIDSVVELQALMVQGTDESSLHWALGKTATFVGLLTSMLLLPRDHLDPAVKARAKTTYYKENIALLTNEKNMREWISETTVGQSLFRKWIPDHPHVEGIIELCNDYEMKLSLTDEKVAYRGNDESFNKLKLEAKYYIDTVGSPSEILDIVQKLCVIHENEDEEDLNSFSVLQKAQNYSQNLQNFVEKMKEFTMFPDLVFPFLVGVEQIIYGLSLCCHNYQMKEAVVSGHSQKLNHIHEFLKQFAEFSTEKWQSSLHVPSTLLNNSTLVNFKLILSFCKETLPNRGRILYKLVKSAIMEIINEIQIGSYHTRGKLNEMRKLLFSAFQSLYEAWRIQDEKMKKKKAEEETMFKQKTHPADLSDEEKMEKELKEMFPSYAEDFEDTPQCNDDQSKQSSSNSAEDDDDFIHFSAEDMYEVCQLHATVIYLFGDKKSVESKNLFIKLNKEPDFLTPFLLQHEVISSIVTSLGNRLDSFFDKCLLEGQLLRGQELQKLKEQEEDEYYDIYHDPNPQKVVTISPILQKLVKRVSELLQEFPENPNLIQILTVTHRVLNFPVSDPLMKFIVGLELILETTQVWEQNAHSKVSLKSEMDAMTKLIIEFRSKELDLWKKGLQCVIKKQYLNSSKWWFFMFPLFYSDNTYDETEKLVIVKGLQQCLEDSPIGEFPARLSILHIFLREFQLYSSSKTNRGYADILFNIYTYYKQFLPTVEAEIKQIRKPIEKEIKDFVKIARWNDVNFYSVKASVEKSHKFVWKHVKTFEEALKTPAKSAFVLPSRSDSDDGESSWSFDIKPQDYIYEQAMVKTKCFKERKEPFFQNLPTYEKKIVKKAKVIAEHFPVVGYINTLNEFCGNVIEALESATAEGRKSVCTRSREKKQTLNKIQNKKQMLATLFKNLKVIGLSYRQGIILHKEVSALMSTPAFDVSQMKVLKADNAFEDLLLKSSRDTNHYFYKSLAQYAQLQKCMESPSKDLTLDVIHRIQGYGGHLLNLVIEQREDIAKMSQDIDKFGSFLTLLSKIYEKQEFTDDEKAHTIIPPQAYLHESDGELSNLMVILILAAGQFNALIECAPESSLLSEEHHSLTLDQVGLSGILKEDSVWSTIKVAINSFNCDIKTLLHQFSNLKFSQTLVSWEEIKTFNGICQSVQHCTEKLIKKVSEKCDSECSMVQNLFSLYNRVNQQCKVYKDEEIKMFESQKVEEPVEDSKQAVIISKLCQKVATEVLLAIQEMVLFSSAVNEDKSNIDVVPEGLFTSKISNSLSEAKKCLHLDKVLMLARRLNVHVSHIQKSFDVLLPCDKSFRLLVNLAPLLNQYYQLVKVYMAIAMGMHRTSCKFLSILLEIFNILAVKGFCIPPELQEEAAKTDATKFEDIESGGLGEGEGSKDVSDKIETEDQLEDALQKGEEKKEQEENKDLKDEEQGIEMSNDFDGKAHSGEDADKEDGEDEEAEDEELDKQMGDVEEDDDAEKLDEKVWGSDSENEDELKEEDGSGGITDNGVSELVAKDNKFKEEDEGGDKSKEEQTQDVPMDDDNEEYRAEKPDPMVDAAPEPEPELTELPEDMEITDDVDRDGTDEAIEMTEPEDIPDESKGDEPDANEKPEEIEKEGEANKAEEIAEGEDEMKGKDAVDPNEVEDLIQETDIQKQDDNVLPTQTSTAEVQALPSELEKSSSDPVQPTEAMDWEMGAQSSEEQHKEGLAEATNMPSEEPGHEGKKSSSGARELTEKSYNPKLKPPGENRTLDENVEEQDAQRRSVQDRKSTIPYESNQDDGDTAEIYEHVSKEEEGTTQAIDIATKEQAEKGAIQAQEDPEVIELSSSDDEDDEPCSKPVGDKVKLNQSQKSGERGDMGEIEENMDITEGEIVHAQAASRGAESTIHTLNVLWKSLSSGPTQRSKARSASHANMPPLTSASCSSSELWRYYEMQVSNLSQELCEQLRLVLEPTKMSKFKGDFRTGKRLNMRKIIPYIASQFRKDKIWLRRTKPTKRQYQIMLAVDDSSSMSDNNSKQLAFESLAVLGQSLTLLEAGELSVVSFGENVQLLHGFQEQFSSSAGAKILEHFTFSQQKTKIAQLLNYATDSMVQARNSAHSRLASKETAQLLVIISDGRGIYHEGENTVKSAVKNARDNNIFMVFLILDNPANKDSILDITCPVFEDKKTTRFIPYMDKFPFPFYIILREISALPQVLGEALRQWFELVTSVDR